MKHEFNSNVFENKQIGPWRTETLYQSINKLKKVGDYDAMKQQ